LVIVLTVDGRHSGASMATSAKVTLKAIGNALDRGR